MKRIISILGICIISMFHYFCSNSSEIELVLFVNKGECISCLNGINELTFEAEKTAKATNIRFNIYTNLERKREVERMQHLYFSNRNIYTNNDLYERLKMSIKAPGSYFFILRNDSILFPTSIKALGNRTRFFQNLEHQIKSINL